MYVKRFKVRGRYLGLKNLKECLNSMGITGWRICRPGVDFDGYATIEFPDDVDAMEATLACEEPDCLP